MSEPKVLTVAEVAEIKKRAGEYDAWEHCQEVLRLCATIEHLTDRQTKMLLIMQQCASLDLVVSDEGTIRARILLRELEACHE